MKHELSELLSRTARLGGLIATVMMLSWGASAHAQTGAFPNKPVHIIVPYAPGGGNDILARLIGERLTTMWGQAVVVDNRAGAGATLGTQLVAKAAPDGYTLLLSSIASHAIGPNLYKRPGYDPIKDFAAITMIAKSPIILVVNAQLPIANVKEFVAYVKARPGALSYGSAGNGSVTHLAGEVFKIQTGIDMVHVPYSGGAPSLLAAQAGDVIGVFEPSTGALTAAAGGRVKALAVARSERLPDHPEIPTFAEAGFPEYTMATWYSLHAPAGTPRPIIDKIARDVATVLATADMKERVRKLGNDPDAGTPEQLDAFVKSELARYEDVLRKSGAQID
ncbi:tripartite tricarboxylate transporter substrate binding protein [soil metagenome]